MSDQVIKKKLFSKPKRSISIKKKGAHNPKLLEEDRRVVLDPFILHTWSRLWNVKVLGVRF